MNLQIDFTTNMFATLLIKWAQLLTAAMMPQEDRYRKYTKFNGMKGPVNCLAFNPNGELLASGGMWHFEIYLIFLDMILAAGDNQTVRIWELSTKSCLQVLEDHGKRWGQITCLSWLSGHNDSSLLNAIAFGTARGLIVIYRCLRMGVSSNLSWRSKLTYCLESHGWSGQ